MGAGFHSINGLKQCINGKLWPTYVIPRLLYGLEVLELKQSDIKQLEQYQRKSLKQIQHLPDRTQNSVTLALLSIGIVIHKNMLNLFWRWHTSEGSEREICLRQLAMKSPAENSWFNRVRDLLRRYGLPSPSVLLEQPLSKPKWKSMVDEVISSSVEETWREDIQSKSLLKYINPNKVEVGHSHPVWSTVRDSVYDSRRAQTKCRLLTAHIFSRATGLSLISMLWMRHVNCVAVPQKLVSTFWLNVKL